MNFNSLEELYELRFRLCWFQHKGSGCNITWQETSDLFISEAIWLRNRISKQRSDELKEIKKAMNNA